MAVKYSGCLHRSSRMGVKMTWASYFRFQLSKMVEHCKFLLYRFWDIVGISDNVMNETTIKGSRIRMHDLQMCIFE